VQPTRLERASVVAAGVAEVWARVTTFEGINDELRPVLTMTPPRVVRGRTVADVLPGTHLGRSVLRLGGLLPVDRDDITIAEIDHGRRFLERSTMLAFRLWEHERTLVEQGPDACTVRDRVSFELRAPLARIPRLAPAVRRLVGALFTHRHRRLVRFFETG